MGGVAHQEDTAAPVAVDQEHAGGPRVGGEHLHGPGVPGADETAHQRLGCHRVVGVGPLDDGPPPVVQVETAHETGGLGAHHPVLHRPVQADRLAQARCPEHDAEVGPFTGRARVDHSDGLPADSAAAVTAQQIVGREHAGGAVGGGDRCVHGVFVLLDGGDPVAGQAGDRGQCGHRRAQEPFDDRLRDLLARLRPALVASVVQAEHIAEPGQFGAEEAGAEDDVLGPGHRQRGGRAQAVGQAPAAEVLHGADAGGLGPRPVVVDGGARFDEHGPDAAAAEFDRRGETGRPAARDQDPRGRPRHAPDLADASVTGVRRVPSRSTSTSTTSPERSRRGGVRT